MNKPKTTTSHDSSNPSSSSPPPRPGERPEGGRPYQNPLHYEHPYPSMGEFARLLTLRHDANRTRHSYYRDLRLIAEHFGCDPATLNEAQLRDYILHIKSVKGWKPKTIRQSAASARVFFVEMLGHEDWKVFGQVRTKDHEELPAVLTRQQVHALLSHIRLRRYRTPLKLIYCCGLRLSECLALTVHDILGDENKLWIRHSKNHRDRLVPLPDVMVEDLRQYWRFHRNPLLIFPHVGRGRQRGEPLRQRMKEATTPMPYSSLQRLMLAARKELNLPGASVHTLRHSFATHLLEAGASLHTIQRLLGHKQINSSMVYLHLTHHSSQDALELMSALCQGLPR